MALNKPVLNFGLVEVNVPTVSEIGISNVSAGVGAAWRLAVSEGGANADEIEFDPVEGVIGASGSVTARVTMTVRHPELKLNLPA